jgi:hypothetical protein
LTLTAIESLNLVKTQHGIWIGCIQEVGILPFGGHMSDSFENAGYGQGEVGWGTKPAIIAVDFQMSFCDPKFALGRSEHAQRAIKNAARLFPAARAAGIPIIHTAVAWSTDTEFARWKVPAFAIFIQDPMKLKFTQIYGMTAMFTSLSASLLHSLAQT